MGSLFKNSILNPLPTQTTVQTTGGDFVVVGGTQTKDVVLQSGTTNVPTQSTTPVQTATIPTQTIPQVLPGEPSNTPTAPAATTPAQQGSEKLPGSPNKWLWIVLAAIGGIVTIVWLIKRK